MKIDSQKEYDKLFSTWEDSLASLNRSLDTDGKKLLFVAMSRKMPHIIDVMRRNKEKAFSKLNFKFITEHVLPYALRDFDSKCQRIVILDDAVYFGSTLNQITGYVEGITKTKAYVLPVVVSEIVESLPHAENFKTESNTISLDSIPYYTTSNAAKIIALSRPIDVEFPILRFAINRLEDAEKNILGTLSKYFSSIEYEIFPIEHRIDGKNVIKSFSILPKRGTKFDRWNNDFSKLRLFVSSNEIEVVAYAPCAFSENSILEKGILFTDNRVQTMWEMIRDSQTAQWPFEKDENLTQQQYRKSYEKQCLRSKVIWANYLASFMYLLEFKAQLCSAISELFGDDTLKTAGFSVEDTSLLLPEKLYTTITSKLKSVYDEGKEIDSEVKCIHSEALANQKLVPKDCRDDYESKNRRGWMRCKSTKEALSLLFSNQHAFISDGRLGNDFLRRVQRLTFGVTYAAIEKDLSFPLGVEGLWPAIHEWMDKNIDEGTVKPKYERIEQDGNYYWLRMFRAGENENSFDKMRRICEFIVKKLQDVEQRNFVERYSVENLLTIVWEDPCGIISQQYRWDVFEKKQEGLNYSLTYESGSEQCGFVDFLVNQGYLQDIQDSKGTSRLALVEGIKQVATQLTSAQEQAVCDYVEAYYYYKDIQGLYYVMNNFFPRTDYDALKKALFKWVEEFSSFMDKEATPHGDASEGMQETFEKKSKDLDAIADSMIRESEIESFVGENENRKRIQMVLSDVESEEYEIVKQAVVKALVVKGLVEVLFFETKLDKEDLKAVESYLDFVQIEEPARHIIMGFSSLSLEERNANADTWIMVVRLLVDCLHNIIAK